MRDLAFLGFLLALIGLGFKRPFLFVLAYVYVDIVAPQRLCYFLLNSVPLSLIMAGLAVAGWLAADDKATARIAPRQWLMLAILGWAAWTTVYADEPLFAWTKWDWAWKAMVFAIFLPLTLRTRLRIEAVLAFIILSTASIVIVGGIKTLASGGGYGELNLMVDNNSGLYEGSIISTVAIAIIPLILWLGRYGTIFPRDRRSKLFVAALIFACLLIPVGTQARTGLICIGLLVVLLLRDAKRRMLYITCIAALGAVAVPLLPHSFNERMATIKDHQADQSASTRIAVWQWTWAYALKHPLGGGFEMYRQNHIRFETVKTASDAAGGANVTTQVMTDDARAYHNSYFEMLGEQGFPGLFMFLMLHVGGLVRMAVLRRRYLKAEGDEAWIAPLATALQSAQLIYMVGACFVGIAFLPVMLMIVGVQIGLDGYLAERRRRAEWRPLIARVSTLARRPVAA